MLIIDAVKRARLDQLNLNQLLSMRDTVGNYAEGARYPIKAAVMRCRTGTRGAMGSVLAPLNKPDAASCKARLTAFKSQRLHLNIRLSQATRFEIGRTYDQLRRDY